MFPCWTLKHRLYYSHCGLCYILAYFKWSFIYFCPYYWIADITHTHQGNLEFTCIGLEVLFWFLFFFFQITVRYSFLVFLSMHHFTLCSFLWFWLSHQQASWEALPHLGQTVSIPRSLWKLYLGCSILLRTRLTAAARFKSLSAAWLLDELEFQAPLAMGMAGRGPGPWGCGWKSFPPVALVHPHAKLWGGHHTALLFGKRLSALHAQLRPSTKTCRLGAQCKTLTVITVITCPYPLLY